MCVARYNVALIYLELTISLWEKIAIGQHEILHLHYMHVTSTQQS